MPLLGESLAGQCGRATQWITRFDVKSDILPSNTSAIRFRLWGYSRGLRRTNVEHTFAIGDSGTGLYARSGRVFVSAGTCVRLGQRPPQQRIVPDASVRGRTPSL